MPANEALQIARHDADVEMLRHCISAAGGEQFSGAAMLMDALLETSSLVRKLRTWLSYPPTEQQAIK